MILLLGLALAGDPDPWAPMPADEAEHVLVPLRTATVGLALHAIGPAVLGLGLAFQPLLVPGILGGSTLIVASYGLELGGALTAVHRLRQAGTPARATLAWTSLATFGLGSVALPLLVSRSSPSTAIELSIGAGVVAGLQSALLVFRTRSMAHWAGYAAAPAAGPTLVVAPTFDGAAGLALAGRF